MSDKFALIAAEQADDHEQQLTVGLMCKARVPRTLEPGLRRRVQGMVVLCS